MAGLSSKDKADRKSKLRTIDSSGDTVFADPRSSFYTNGDGAPEATLHDIDAYPGSAADRAMVARSEAWAAANPQYTVPHTADGEWTKTQSGGGYWNRPNIAEAEGLPQQAQGNNMRVDLLPHIRNISNVSAGGGALPAAPFRSIPQSDGPTTMSSDGIHLAGTSTNTGFQWSAGGIGMGGTITNYVTPHDSALLKNMAGSGLLTDPGIDMNTGLPLLQRTNTSNYGPLGGANAAPMSLLHQPSVGGIPQASPNHGSEPSNDSGPYSPPNPSVGNAASAPAPVARNTQYSRSDPDTQMTTTPHQELAMNSSVGRDTPMYDSPTYTTNPYVSPNNNPLPTSGLSVGALGILGSNTAPQGLLSMPSPAGAELSAAALASTSAPEMVSMPVEAPVVASGGDFGGSVGSDIGSNIGGDFGGDVGGGFGFA